MLLSNLLAGGKVVPDPIICEKITSNVMNNDEDEDIYPACVVTRAIKRKREKNADHSQALDKTKSSTDLDGTKTSMEPHKQTVKNKPLSKFRGDDDELNLPLYQDKDILSREQLLSEQHNESDIVQLSKKELRP